MHFRTLALQRIDVRLEVADFALQTLNLVRVRSNCLVESLQEKIRSGLVLERSAGRIGIASTPAHACAVAVAHVSAALLWEVA